MNGAQSLIRTLANCGVDVCFGNPGTSEMHFVASLDAVPSMRAVLCLFEGVATGAADGYGRMAGKPAAVLLHLGPGLANGLANLHNARRASTPIVNIVGDHATYHLQYDAPLTSDIAGFARPVSTLDARIEIRPQRRGRCCTCRAGCAIGARRHRNADPSGRHGLERGGPRIAATCRHSAGPRCLARLSPTAASLLKNGKRSMMLLRGAALRGAGLEAAGKIAAKAGARLACDTFAPHTELGAGRVAVERIPYFAEQIVEFMASCEQLVLVGAKPPVSFFAYPGKPSWCTPQDCRITQLAHEHEDSVGALRALAEALGASSTQAARQSLALPDLPRGALDAQSVAQAIAHLTPEHAIFADESATAGFPLAMMMPRARPHDHLALTGGSIGLGLPLAVGAAIACPDRKVICPHGDGGAAYTMQALWTMVRENLDVTVVIYANRSYAILNIELQRVGASGAGPKALSMLDLHNPEMNWMRIANGIGMEATRATTARSSRRNTSRPCASAGHV